MGKECKEEILQHTINCQEKNKKERHDFRAELHKDILNLDNKVDKNIADINEVHNTLNLITQATKTMSDNIEEIKVLMKEGFQNIEEKFVTKAEMSPYKWGTGILVAGLIGAFVQKLSSLIY